MSDPGRPRALLLEGIHANAVSRLTSEGYQVETLGRALDEDELIARIGAVHLLGIRSKTTVSAAALKAAPDLVAIGAFCIGTDQIDMHAGLWDKAADGSHEVRGRSLGIVGYGNIGTQLSVLAENLGMTVYFFDTADKLALGNARRCDTLDELLGVADVVTLHVDGRPGNSGFFGEEQFARMRDGSLFLNLSRGFVIDHAALRAHLDSGHLAGAAVDVFPQEPKGRGDEFVSALRGLPNVILTPHIGGSTEEAQADIGAFVAGKLHQYHAEGVTTLSVNVPPVALPQQPGTHRLVHIHRNTPGVLAAVNSILAAHAVNVEGQLLGTRGEIGFLLTDIGTRYSDEVLDRLRAMEQTIRLRVLS
ncbi:MAG: D-3-phosphoglycerate dehydrogenase [Actinobacteria bacterium 13_2_20CM_2_71_6]|nr:MAG: D-3-phosphoglycerate dehydrogenase [Actinobacteria bacterium 13_2_20CM_2_71_6]